MPLRRSASVLLAILVLLAIAAPVAAAKGGNSTGSAACENGGYVNWTRQDGTTFKNEGACVKYAAKNTLKPVVVVTFLEFTPTVGTGSFNGQLTGAGLQPGAAVVGHATDRIIGALPDVQLGTVASDGTLNLSVGFTTCNALAALWFTTTDASGNEIRDDVIPVPC